jgi:1-phosphofructokinase
MILSVTPNSTIDWTLFLPNFRWNETIRSTKAAWGIGGKPAGAAWILGELGIKTLAIGFMAGVAGEKMLELMHRKGVETDFIPVQGETRLNVHLVNQENGGQSTLAVDTLIINQDHVRLFLEKYEAALHNASAVITGSSLPKCLDPKLFQQIISMAHQRSVPVAFDSSGPYLAAGLKAHPAIIKPNRAELASITGRTVETIEDTYTAAKEVLQDYGTQVVATLGEKGALAVLRDRTLHIQSLKVEKLESTAGAGDAVLAGIAYALAFDKPMEEGLRLGFAAAGAVIQTLATADCHKEDVEKLLETIELIPYN